MTILKTKRLTLWEYCDPDDLRTMVKWLNDPDVVRYSEQRYLKHNVKFQEIYIRMIQPPNKFKQIFTKDKFIGTITARVDENNSVANVGILIGEKSEWGKGYGTEAWVALCDHLLNNGIRKIEAGCMNTNFGMIHIFRKYHMFLEGVREQHFLCDNQLVGMSLWGKFA